MKTRSLMNKIATVVAPPVTPVVAPTLVPNVLPWLVGGTGILVGLLNITTIETKAAFFGLIGLVVALTAILAQPFNPAWLSHVVFFVRVFAAHILLVVSIFYFRATARN